MFRNLGMPSGTTLVGLMARLSPAHYLSLKPLGMRDASARKLLIYGVQDGFVSFAFALVFGIKGGKFIRHLFALNPRHAKVDLGDAERRTWLQTSGSTTVDD